MFSAVSELLKKKRIELVAPISLSDCRITRKYLLDRVGIENGSVFIFAVPYLSSAALGVERNISVYAAPPDYHAFFAALFEEILPALRVRFPSCKFVGFADHSPIDERHAAASAGLGILGDNGMLITEKYSSYVFLGEIITDATVQCVSHLPIHCESCGACRASCPYSLSGTCLSSLTQKKGILSSEEEADLVKFSSAWGCDICQEVCPHTKRALISGTALSPIRFFNENVIPKITPDIISDMSDGEFACRAYSWRGRETIMRNLTLLHSSQSAVKEFSSENEEGRKKSAKLSE